MYCAYITTLKPPPNKSTKVFILSGNIGTIIGSNLYLPPT